MYHFNTTAMSTTGSNEEKSQQPFRHAAPFFTHMHTSSFSTAATFLPPQSGSPTQQLLPSISSLLAPTQCQETFPLASALPQHIPVARMQSLPPSTFEDHTYSAVPSFMVQSIQDADSDRPQTGSSTPDVPSRLCVESLSSPEPDSVRFTVLSESSQNQSGLHSHVLQKGVSRQKKPSPTLKSHSGIQKHTKPSQVHPTVSGKEVLSRQESVMNSLTMEQMRMRSEVLDQPLQLGIPISRRNPTILSIIMSYVQQLRRRNRNWNQKHNSPTAKKVSKEQSRKDKQLIYDEIRANIREGKPCKSLEDERDGLDFDFDSDTNSCSE